MTGSPVAGGKAKDHEVHVQNINVECSIDSLVSTTDNVGLQTKASKLFYKIIGQSEELIRFDNLRVKFKQNKVTPTITEYETLLVKLQSRILSIKYKTKDTLKTLEKQCMAAQGLNTDHLHSNADLYKKLQFIKRVLTLWKFSQTILFYSHYTCRAH